MFATTECSVYKVYKDSPELQLILQAGAWLSLFSHLSLCAAPPSMSDFEKMFDQQEGS